MRISDIEFRAGSSLGQESLKLSVEPITVFVGPNYSGKSQAIAEIATKCNIGYLPNSSLVLDSVKVEPLSDADISSAFENMKVPLLRGEVPPKDHETLGRRGERFHIPKYQFEDALKYPNPEVDPWGGMAPFAQFYGRFRFLLLNGQNRIGLINEHAAGDLQGPPHTSFQQIFRNDNLRKRLSEIVFRAFGQHIVVDPTTLGQLRLKLSKVEPESDAFERSLTQAAIEFYAEATPLTATSDGAKAFVGIMAEILAGNPDVLLMDEPEAFLHPALAYQLGKEVSQEVSQAKKQMFVSTHSPQFLMGCIQSGVPINVVRLTYRDGVATARILPSDDLRALMRNPLLRSVGVISALFYESVIVTEADPDRAFYQEINERLLSGSGNRGIQNALFLNAQNKQTIPTILKPLRRLGIPVAAIYDIDLVKDGGGVATKFLSSAGVPDLSQQSLAVMRSSVLEALKKTGNFKTNGGIANLSDDDRQSATDYLDTLKSYGAFVVPRGELESWLKNLGVTGHGPSWLVSMFERLGEDPGHPDYVGSGEGDVWAFMDEVRAWLLNPARKGIPT